MALSPKKPRRIPAGILAIILSLFSAVLMTVWVREGAAGPLHTAREAALVVIGPVQQIGNVVMAPVHAMTRAIESVTASIDDVESLRAKNQELEAQVIRLEEQRLANERLSKLLSLVDAYSFESRAAHIISRSTDSFNQTISIDLGSNDGMTVGLPVLNANGLLGQIEACGPGTSVVRLITDPHSGVAVFIERNRAEGVLAGSAEGVLYLDFISQDTDVQVGDPVITSGAGGVYPKGIVIGMVTSVSSDPTAVYKSVIVTPVRRVAAYEEVLILTGRPDEVSYDPSKAGGS
jgi:rod shape-determining protein MreC